MLKGLDKLKEFFLQPMQKTLCAIDGAACNLLEEEYAQNPRATKDLDLILVVEVFSAYFWQTVLCLYQTRQVHVTSTV